MRLAQCGKGTQIGKPDNSILATDSLLEIVLSFSDEASLSAGMCHAYLTGPFLGRENQKSRKTGTA